ncbi:fungal-specific transcription factor domain-containing protein [Aspergillus crustosus]
MDPQNSGVRRTRSGCWNCKKRRRRCSEDKPSCTGCQVRGLTCQYGIRLLWEHEAESMGIAFGRAGTKDRPSRDKKSSTGAHYLLPQRQNTARYWLNTTSNDIQYLHGSSNNRRVTLSTIDDQLKDEVTTGRQHTPNNTIPLPLSQCPSLAEIDRFLFHYFSDTCTIRRSLVDHENPWRSVLLPLCYRSEGLLHIAIAWAAHTLRNQCASQDVSRYDQMILTHKCRSLRYLRNMVPQCASDSSISLASSRDERDALLLLVMLHCLLEIASGSIMEWTYHMKGALLIMRFYTRLGSMGNRNIFSREVLELVYSFFLEKGTFLGTTVTAASSKEDEKCLDSLEWSTAVPSMFPFLTNCGSMKVNPCLGLSSELLDIISAISDLSRRRRSSQQSISHEFKILRHRLTSLQASFAFQSDEFDLMSLHSAAFQEATWIYLHHAINNQPAHSDIIQMTHLPKLLNILAQIHKIHGTLLAFIPYPMWALFIASCVVLENDRAQILEWFTILKRNKPVNNVPSTMAAVEAIWKRKDLESDEAGSRLAPIWTAAISRLGWKMPFT